MIKENPFCHNRDPQKWHHFGAPPCRVGTGMASSVSLPNPQGTRHGTRETAETHARRPSGAHGPWYRCPCLSLSDGNAPSRAPHRQPPATARCASVFLNGGAKRRTFSHGHPHVTSNSTRSTDGSFFHPRRPENPRTMTHRASWCARVETCRLQRSWPSFNGSGSLSESLRCLCFR